MKGCYSPVLSTQNNVDNFAMETIKKDAERFEHWKTKAFAAIKAGTTLKDFLLTAGPKDKRIAKVSYHNQIAFLSPR